MQGELKMGFILETQLHEWVLYGYLVFSMLLLLKADKDWLNGKKINFVKR
jgi:hypothetical protein